jgi:hypothetical protein
MPTFKEITGLRNPRLTGLRVMQAIALFTGVPGPGFARLLSRTGPSFRAKRFAFSAELR